MSSVIRARDVPTGLCAAAVFRWAGVRSAIVTVNGRHPVLLTGGSMTCGRLFLRCKTIDRVGRRQERLACARRACLHQQGCPGRGNAQHRGRLLIGAWWPFSTLTSIPWTRPTLFAPVRLGANVWVGRSATILPGLTIGDHAVIAAGSIVMGDVPARTLMAGVPARPI
jgi:hypothetical protein